MDWKRHVITLDRWIHLRAPPRTAVVLIHLRERLNEHMSGAPLTTTSAEGVGSEVERLLAFGRPSPDARMGQPASLCMVVPQVLPESARPTRRCCRGKTSEMGSKGRRPARAEDKAPDS